MHAGAPHGYALTPGDWRGFRQPDFPAASWLVADGTLVAQVTRAPVDLITRERFGDFDLTFEWCVPAGGNSGVLYRVSEDAEQTWQSGPELQLLDDRQHPDARHPLRSCGALYDVMAPEPRLSLAPAAFHTGRVVMREFALEHWIGGVRVLTCDLQSRGVRNQIAESKFADLPLFGQLRDGHIALQHHGPGAAFRRLRIDRSSHG